VSASEKSSFILLDLVSGNVMTDFASERDACDALRHWATEDGLDAMRDLALGRIRHGQHELVAMDDELVRRIAREFDVAGGNDREVGAMTGRSASRVSLTDGE
jgi:hypothetical protein